MASFTWPETFGSKHRQIHSTRAAFALPWTTFLVDTPLGNGVPTTTRHLHRQIPHPQFNRVDLEGFSQFIHLQFGGKCPLCPPNPRKAPVGRCWYKPHTNPLLPVDFYTDRCTSSALPGTSSRYRHKRLVSNYVNLRAQSAVRVAPHFA